MPDNTPSPLEAIEILKCRTCGCGSPKNYKTAFCGGCYRLLPPALKRAMYQQIGFGFEQAYTLALQTIGERG